MSPTAALSVVVPAYDEAPNLPRLAGAVRAALDPLGIAWELVVVDDGSDDDTPAVLARLAAEDERVRPLRLARRSGQTAALVAGFRAARHPLIATLDADLQCAPADLPALLTELDGADLACGIRARRHDPPSRRVASALANLARRAFLAGGVRDLACPLRVFRADALARVEAVTPLFDGAHRWLPALFALAGLRVVQRPVAHHPRTAGTSKYDTRGRIRPILREVGQVLPLAFARSPGLRIVGGLGLLALATFVFLYRLGSWPLMEPDEGRNAEIAREMLVDGHWSVPHFNGLPYLDKPVLLFWMIAGAFRALGVGEAAARLPSAVAGIATVALTFDLGRLLLDRRRGLLAAAIVATTPLVLTYARLVIFDLPLTALTTAALVCLVRARLAEAPWRWHALAGLAMGLATLMKGPVGILVPLLAWIAGRGALAEPAHRSRGRGVLAAVAVVALVVVPWLAMVEQAQPGFLRYALLDETFLRVASSSRFHRGAPFYYYPMTLSWGLGAWTVVLAALAPGLVRRWRAGGPDARVIAFAARATVALVVFFTACASKRPHYILPAVVPVALLAAVGIAADVQRVRTVLHSTARWTLAAGFVGIGLAVAAAGGELPPGAFRVLSPALLTSAGIFLVAWSAAVLAANRRAVLVIGCGALFAPGLGLALLGPLTPYAESRSSRVLATYVDPAAEVVCFDTFRTSLPFYLGRPIVLASDSGAPLTSNYVRARRPDLRGRPSLVSERAVTRLLGATDQPYVLASRWNAARLTRMSPRALETVHSDRQSILFRPRG